MARKLIAVVPSALVKPLMAWFKGTHARRTLADLPAYLLSDIGLRHDQIAGLAGQVGTSPARPLAAETGRAPGREPRPLAAEVIDMTQARARTKPARAKKPMAA